jgi:hypothetical protein
MIAIRLQRPRGRWGRLLLALLPLLTALAWAQASPAHAEPATCTWGGTPADPTGTFTMSPGLTNSPSPVPLKFQASGELGGSDPRCKGEMKWVGQVDAGSSCFFASFEFTVKGWKSAADAWGKGGLDVPSYMYDNEGNLVGIENAQIVTRENIPQYSGCGTPEGFTGPATYSSNIVLFR